MKSRKNARLSVYKEEIVLCRLIKTQIIQIFIAGDKIVMFLYIRLKLKKNLEWGEGRFADGFIFRNGKVIQMRSFGERQEALDWAGIKNSGT